MTVTVAGEGEGEGKKGETGRPGWRIVRSIVRLLYLVPSFCGSLSHPSLFLYLPSSRVLRSSPPCTSRERARARSSRSCSYSCFLSSSLLPLPHRPPPVSLPLCFLSFSLVHVPSPFLDSFPLSATQHHHHHHHHRLSRCSHIVLAASAARETPSGEEGKRRECRRSKREPHARTRVCVWPR